MQQGFQKKTFNTMWILQVSGEKVKMDKKFKIKP